MLPCRSRFVYLAVDLRLTWPAKTWDPWHHPVGSWDISGAGIPAAYTARIDMGVALVLRVLETEWLDLVALVEFGQTAEPFLWYPDADEGTNFQVYLDAPMPPDRLAPTRVPNWPKMFETTLQLRGVGSVVPWREYFQ